MTTDPVLRKLEEIEKDLTAYVLNEYLKVIAHKEIPRMARLIRAQRNLLATYNSEDTISVNQYRRQIEEAKQRIAKLEAEEWK